MDFITITIGSTNDRKKLKFLIFLSLISSEATNKKDKNKIDEIFFQCRWRFVLHNISKVFVFHRHKLKFLLLLNRFDIFLRGAEAISR